MLTTICCRSLVIIAFCGVVVWAQQKSEPGGLFPVQSVWVLALNNPVTVPPAYDSTSAFFSIGGDRVVAYDLKSGTQKWIVTAQPQFQPAAGDGLLMFAEPDGLTALRAEDGSVAWRLPLAEKPAQRPVWDNGWLIVAAEGGTVRAYRATDGYMVWLHDLGSRAHAPPALAADRVYVPTDDGRIVALAVETGSPEWERKLGGAPHDILAFDDRLFAGAQDNFFYCLIAKDGRIDWRWRTGGDAVGTPVADDRRVYFVAMDNVLRGMNRISGSQVWMRPLPFRPIAGAVAAGRSLVVSGQVVSGQGPTLRGYRMSDGSAAGEIQATPEIGTAPFAFTDSDTGLPALLYVTRDLTKGATATLVRRSLEPPTNPIAPLPNPIMPTPIVTGQ
jgi:outer membrane protein assembly factor BamB